VKVTPYLVVNGGYAGLTPRREVAESHQCILGAALVGVNVVLPWREAEGGSWHPGFGTGRMPRGAITAQLMAHPWLQPLSSWDAAWLPSRCSTDAHETQLSSSPKPSSLPNRKELPVPLSWPGTRPALPVTAWGGLARSWANAGGPDVHPSTVRQAGVSQQQLLAGGRRVGFGAIGVLDEGLQLPAQGVQQSPDRSVIQVVGGIN